MSLNLRTEATNEIHTYDYSTGYIENQGTIHIEHQSNDTATT